VLSFDANSFKKARRGAPGVVSRKNGKKLGVGWNVSAIIPLYNGQQFIEEALQSVARQTVPILEIIVIDDGSTDRSHEIVEGFDTTIPLRLVEKENGGQSSARNLGAKLAKGDLLAFLDQDDVWYPNHVEELSKPFSNPSYPEIGWTYGNLDEIDETGKLITKSFLSRQSAPHPKTDIFSCLREDMFILPSASLISKKAFGSLGGFDESLSGYEDDDLFLRMFQAGYDSVFIDRPLSRWRIYPSSNSYSWRMAHSRMIYAQKLLDNFPDDPARARYYARDLIAPRFFSTLYGECKKHLKNADRAAFLKTASELLFFAKLLRPGRRTLYRVLTPFISSYGAARFSFRARMLVQPLLDKIFLRG
jgi:glycosyltransferase involved in cell wall biosynthesis